MSAHGTSDALHARVRALVRAFERGEPMPEPFDALAVDLVRFQAAHVPGYQRLCEAHGIDPRSITRAEQAPAVPTDAFRLANVFAFNEKEAAATFGTSGTTGGSRGTHRMRVLGTYEAAALALGRSMFARGLAPPVVVLVVGPSLEEAPDSSLAYMCALFARVFAERRSLEETFFVRGKGLQLDALRRTVQAAQGRGAHCPILVLATSLALTVLLEAVGDERLVLPARSRIMQTGGFKTKSRELPSEALRHAIAKAFAVEERAVVSEYGMTELSSQFWEATLVDPASRHGTYVEPPWARVIPVDPATLVPVPPGEVGIARIEDLANVDSAFAVLTQDRVRRVRGGFELLGRSPDAPPRGCSIGLDEMLSTGERA